VIIIHKEQVKGRQIILKLQLRTVSCD